MDRTFNTLNYGFKFACKRDITKQYFMDMCKELSVDFNLVVEPEPITEGGFVFKYEDRDAYKSMRFHTKVINELNHIQGDKFKIIKRDLGSSFPSVKNIADWRYSNEIIFKEGTIVLTFLKSAGSASRWTRYELELCDAVFNKYGMECYKYPPRNRIK
jgi:hypothetical protein